MIALEVTKAVNALGMGPVDHPDHPMLRTTTPSGSSQLFQELLRQYLG